CKYEPHLMADENREQQAKELCWSCPAIGECRAWVMGLHESQDPGGVTAGLNQTQRKGRRLAATFRKRRLREQAGASR
ncbi:MAG: Transcription factor WhiB, partial [Gemmatimonadales bacterium]|nr:Transcription factor WhiB [Gemmatimonadales bacterium]